LNPPRTAAYWIEKLQLLPHPEGGHYRETYRKDPVSSAIFFLLQSGERSRLHRLKSDELWHFHVGSPLTLFLIHPGGRLETLSLGDSPEKGEAFQAVIPAGCWFGARVNEPDSFALIGCTVAPGFLFEDFELADRHELTRQFPQHRKIIEKLTPGKD